MLLNRIYDEQDLVRFKNQIQETSKEWEAKFQASGVPVELVPKFAKEVSDRQVPPPQLAGVEIAHTGAKADQNFSTSLVTEFVQLGIMEIHEDELILHASPEDLHYEIRRGPGRWCLHCGEKLPDDTNGELARLHMATEHKGQPSPIESEPSGYVWLTYFECVLDQDQHDKFKKGA